MLQASAIETYINPVHTGTTKCKNAVPIRLAAGQERLICGAAKTADDTTAQTQIEKNGRAVFFITALPSFPVIDIRIAFAFRIETQ